MAAKNMLDRDWPTTSTVPVRSTEGRIARVALRASGGSGVRWFVSARRCRRQGAAATLLALAILLLGAACSGGTSSPPDEPASPDGSLVAGGFLALPKPPGTQPLEDPVVEGEAIVQSYQVTGSTPQQVLDFYIESAAAAGWEPSSPPAEVGDGDWRGDWARADQTLRVSASPDSDNGNDFTVVSQLDLILTTS